MTLEKNIAQMLIAFRYAKKQTQVKVSKVLGVTFQQVQKYENLQNGISAVKLLKFCNHYNINIADFQNKDPYQIIDGADISIFSKEKALMRVDKLEEKTNDKSGSNESLAGESLGQGTHL